MQFNETQLQPARQIQAGKRKLESVEVRPRLEQKPDMPQVTQQVIRGKWMPSLIINGRLSDNTTCDVLSTHYAKERNPLKNNLPQLLGSLP